MLVEFSVENFCSIRDRQTLSLVASKDKKFLETHTLETKVSAVPRLLRAVGVYGANGSGKSNLLNALTVFHWFVETSFSRSPQDPTAQMPFAFQDNGGFDQPSEFEAIFLINGVRYQYGFRMDKSRIHEEWLLVYQTQKGQAWFERRFQPETGKDEYKFSEKLLGAKKVWEEATRPNALFLSTAVQFNSEMLRPIFEWITNHINSFNVFGADSFPIDWSKSLLADSAKKSQILSFLQKCDISVSDIHQSDNKDLFFQHRVGSRNFYIPFNNESLGTRRLFTLAGPILEVLQRGELVIVDELESSLHPLLVRRLLELFHDPKVNAKGAQLVFTTHNTQLLDQTTFRRDQIWLVEKDVSESTRLVPLTEFQIRKDLSLEKAYLDGRFGAIPILSNTEP
ncbi:MAG: ATP-binding protein [Fibrobacteres bacterium]|nr:ATP-binding protein [Fibrobacterota bacterium]